MEHGYVLNVGELIVLIKYVVIVDMRHDKT